MSNFVIKKNPTAWWPVVWQEPVDGGGTVQARIEMQFVRTPWEKRDETYQLDELAFIQAVGRDWRGITDDAGRAAEFTAENQAELLARPAFAEALGVAYMAFLRALPETRLGNSEASPGGGPAGAAGTADPPATPTP